MPFTQTSVSFGSPNTTRGIPFTVSTDNAGKFIAYGSGMNVVVRPTASPTTDTLKDTVVCSRHTSVVTCVRMSPFGTFIASGDVEGNVIIWANRADALEKLNFKPIAGPIRDMSWSEDQERIAIVGDGRSGFAGVFAVSGGNTVGSLNGHTKAVNTCDFKKTRPFRIVTGSTEAVAGFFEGPPFKFGHTVSGFTNSVNCVRYSPDGTLIAAVSGSKDVVLLDGMTGQKVRSFTTDHTGSLWSAAWSSDNTKIATCSGDKSVKVWLAADGSKIGEHVLSKEEGLAAGANGQQCGAAFLPDGTLVTVTLGGDIMFFDAALKVVKVLKGHSRPANALIPVVSDGSLVTVADDGKVIAWSTNGVTGTSGAQFTGSQDQLVYAACASTIAGDAEGTVIALANDDIVKINTTTAEVKKLAQHTGGATAIAVAGTNGSVIAVLQKASLTLYNSATGAKLKQFAAADGLGKECGSLAAFDNLLAVGFEKQVKVFTVSADGSLAPFSAYAGVHGTSSGGHVTALAFSADGTYIASGDSSRQLAVWEAKDGAVVRDNMCFHASRVTAVAFSPADSKVLVSGGLDGALIAWDLSGGNAGKKVVHDMAHRGGVTRVAFDAAATKAVISTGADATIKRWSFEL